MDVGKRMRRIDDLDIFESPAKRSRPSPFQISQAVPKRFLKAYTHVPDEKMDTVSFFARIFPALLALLTGELCFQQYKVSLVLKVEMTKGDGKRKVQQPYFSSKPYTILSQHDIENAIEEAHRNIDCPDGQVDKGRLWMGCDSCHVPVRQHCQVSAADRKFVHGAARHTKE